MQLHLRLDADLPDVADRVRALEEAGVDGVYTYEGNRDLLYPLVLAAEHSRLQLATNVAIALPRSPMHLAYAAYDLQRFSEGRFVLGLGSQIKPHVVRRFGARWDRPVAQMRELTLAVRAVFACWHEGRPLDVRGDYYTLDLMTPMFDPGPLACGPPPIWLGALGPRMTTMAAEVADGLFVHPFNTPTYLGATTLPAVAAGLAAAGRERSAFSLGVGAVLGLYRDERDRDAAVQGARFNLAFYGSTPAYKVTLDAHGWGDLQAELARLIRAGRWADIGAAVDDEVLRTIAVVGTPAEVAGELRARYEGVADRLCPSIPHAVDVELLAELADALHS